MGLFILFLIIGCCVNHIIRTPIYALSCLIKFLIFLVLGMITVFAVLTCTGWVMS